MSQKLKQCPCGEIPTELNYEDNGQGYKYVQYAPSCCGEWGGEARTVNYQIHTPETYANVVQAWNEAPRFWDSK